jgi:ABC-type multidrug transport system fused ATPase/permease subunit
MTLTGRNLALRFSTVVLVLVFAAVILAFVGAIRGVWQFSPTRISVNELLAIIGASVSAGLGLILAVIYLGLFRRTPALSVFFVTWFFLTMVFDIFKFGQIILPASPWPQFTAEVSRAGIFGHISGVMAIFAAGLYAGGVRMQRHGTAMIVACMIALGLSWSIPVDTGVLPTNLIHRAGIGTSLQATLVLLIAVSVVNFVHAALDSGNLRGLVTAAAVALVATGREILFYRVEPLWIVLGAAGVLAGGIIFAGQNYRDFLVS